MVQASIVSERGTVPFTPDPSPTVGRGEQVSS